VEHGTGGVVFQLFQKNRGVCGMPRARDGGGAAARRACDPARRHTGCRRCGALQSALQPEHSHPREEPLSSPVHAPAAGDPSSLAPLERELAELLVKALNLEVAAGAIDPAAPLYGDGLGLDSIDILEIALEVSQRYGFELRSDDENNVRIFASLRSLAAHVAAHRTR
jgi:acyl carrier protein